MSLEDALKLDDVRAALRRGDLEAAANLSPGSTLLRPLLCELIGCERYSEQRPAA